MAPTQKPEELYCSEAYCFILDIGFHIRYEHYAIKPPSRVVAGSYSGSY